MEPKTTATTPSPTPPSESAGAETPLVRIPGYGFITPEGTLVNAAQMQYAMPSDYLAKDGLVTLLSFGVSGVNPGEDTNNSVYTAATVRKIAAALDPAPVTGEEIELAYQNLDRLAMCASTGNPTKRTFDEIVAIKRLIQRPLDVIAGVNRAR